MTGMDEYIERETAYKTIMSEPPDAHYPKWYADKILAIPAADVAPVRHGRWVKDGEVVFCSECGEEHAWGEYRATYCEDCGARMDLEEEHDRRRSNSDS